MQLFSTRQYICCIQCQYFNKCIFSKEVTVPELKFDQLANVQLQWHNTAAKNAHVSNTVPDCCADFVPAFQGGK